MTDRELLEMAAKAAGYAVESWRSNGGAWCHPVDEQPDEDGDHPGLFGWNPLTDDGDALRLAVKIRRFAVSTLDEDCYSGPDVYAATRRAIVRAAAEIGRAQA